MIDIIIFAVIAGLLFWKLKNILGKEDENQRVKPIAKFKMKDVSPAEASPNDGGVFNLGFLEGKKESKEQKKNLSEEQIKVNLALIKPEFEEVYKNLSISMPFGVFDVKQFLDGVETLLIELINAQNTKDVSVLVPYISNEFFNNFTAFLKESAVKNPNQIVKLIKIDEMEIIGFESKSDVFFIKVKVLSEQIRYSKEGEVITAGSMSVPSKFIDVLTISRNIKVQGGNWILTNID